MVPFAAAHRGRLAAAVTFCFAAGLVIAAISLGKSGPPAEQSAFALDSSGTGSPAPWVAHVTGPGKTGQMRPSFELGPQDPGTTFWCRMGLRPWHPCTSPFQAPNLGPGRHVVVVMAIDAAGNFSPPLKHPFVVAGQRLPHPVTAGRVNGTGSAH